MPGGGVSPLVELVRDRRDLRAETSTVDNLESAAGQLATVLALAWELDGRSGSFGQGGSVDAAVPVPAPVRIGTPTVPPVDEAQITGPVPEPGSVTEPEPAPAPGPEPGAEQGPGPTTSLEDATVTATP